MSYHGTSGIQQGDVATGADQEVISTIVKELWFKEF